MAKLDPFSLRDFRQGRYTPTQVSNSLIPVNSASHSVNINYDTVVGQPVVRPGYTKLGDTVSPGALPDGLAEFVGQNGSPNTLIVVFDGPGNSYRKGSGTIGDDGSGNITGIGTLFLTEVAVGDILFAPSQTGLTYIVTGIADDTHMTINTPSQIVGASYYLSAQTALLFFFENDIWNQATGITGLPNGVRERFATLGDHEFITNNVTGMQDSSDANIWTQTNSVTGILPSLIYRYTARLLCAGDPTYPDRVYFSTVVDPSVTPFITWDTDISTGDWIDVNPDDGGTITGFSETSTYLLVFKNTGMYRMDTLNKTTDPDNIFNIGAVCQEAITLCQGLTYYYSGLDIRRTNGGFPDQISRAGVQDIIDVIPQANKINVFAWNDDLNVYFSVGDVTIYKNTDRQQTIKNCVLKFSPRDQNWSVHSYKQRFYNGVSFTNSDGRYIRAANTVGEVQTINLGQTDDGEDIYFEFESQDLEFGNRGHLHGISDKLIVFMNNGIDSNIQFRVDGVDLKDVPMSTNRRVNIGKDIDLQGNFFNFRWSGSSRGTAPALEGFQLEDINDLGVNTNYSG